MSPGLPIPTYAEYSPRIEPHVFTAAQFLFLSLAIIACAGRTFTRVYRFKRITIDDIFLILACVFFAASTAVIEYGKNLVYRTTYRNLGLLRNPPDWRDMGVKFSIIDNIVTVLVWAALFSVKLSFVLFFRQLISRVRNIQLWWWIVFIIVCCAAPVNMFMGFYICPDFSDKIHLVCPTEMIIANTYTYLRVSCLLDIITDVLVLSIPVALLWNVQIDLRRKLALGTVLCLSIFMIVIAIVRIAFVQTGQPDRQVPDTPWLFFWQNIEAATAIIMVSVTAFRSMLGQTKTASKNSRSNSARKYVNIRPASDSEPLNKNKAHIIKTTEVSNSVDEKNDLIISYPTRSLSADEQIEMSGEPSRDYRPLPPRPPRPQYEVRVMSPAGDRRYADGGHIERG